MPALFAYLLKANAVLLLFGLTYYLGLRRLTFYRLNRWFLLLGLGFAAIYPAVDLGPLLGPRPALSTELLVLLPQWPPAAAPAAPAPFDWLGLLRGLYWAGVAALGLRLLLQLGALLRLHRRSAPAQLLGQPVRLLAEPASPFSFGPAIYLHPAQHAPDELPAIVQHERVHVRQWHTLDTTLAQLCVVLCWFNPAAWWLRRAVQQNLEFVTDEAVLQAGAVDRRTYQYSLLRLGGLTAGSPLANHFNQFTLKTRIAMMNQPRSAARLKTRYLLLTPLLLTLALGFSAAQAALAPPVVQAPAEPALYYVDGKPSTKAAALALQNQQAIVSMQVLKDAPARQLFGEAAGTGVVIITSKQNQNSAAVRELNDKVARVAPVTTTQQTERPVAVSALPPAALAHITKQYPGYRLVGVTEIKDADGKNLRYKAEIALGRRPAYVVFDAEGQPTK
jgi:hypothetical protein